MTCIVGFADAIKKTVTIGGDSAASCENSIRIRKDSKVFQNGEFLIGCTTSFRMIQLLQYSFTPPEIKDMDLYKYMCTVFITEIRKVFMDNGFMEKTTNGGELGGDFLVGIQGRLFEIQEDFQVAEFLNGMASIGCGNEIAMGALHILNEIDGRAPFKVLKALETSAVYSLGVAPPFTVLTV
jgi:hypothetical protein